MQTSQSAIRPTWMIAAAVASALGSGLFSASIQAAEDQGLEEVTVTGSRIARRDNVASSPIVTVSEETLAQISNLGIESALNQLPQFVPSQTQFSAGDIQSLAYNTPGIASLNLRGLGANRNLVLLDGRRAQPANALLVVDINTIPSAAVENIEIISGGASATYGADAMGGVTNFKLKHKFEGLNISAQRSLTEQGGGAETKVSTLIGATFGNGGNVMLGLEAATRDEILATQRDFYLKGYLDPGTPSGTSSLRFASYKPTAGNAPTLAAVRAIFGPTAPFAAGADSFFVNPSKTTLFLNSPASGALGYTGPQDTEFKIIRGVTGAGALNENNLEARISSPLKRYSMFGRAGYEFDNKLEIYTQGSFTHSKVVTNAAYSPALSQWNATIPRDGRVLPAQLNALLDSRPNPAAPWNLEMGFVDFSGTRKNFNSDDVYQLLAGVKGEIPRIGWDFDVYASHGETKLIAELDNYPMLQAFRAVVQAPNFGANLNQGSGPPLFFATKCTSGLPIFANFKASQDCIDSIYAKMKHLTESKQDIVEANATGKLFALPAGEIQAAVGVSTRRNTFRFRPDALLQTTSLTYPIGLFPTSPTTGETKVHEYYAEAVVPVLKELPLVKQFNLEIGARYSSYNTAGGIWTYKGLVDWSVNNNVRIRGGYQLANRAPNTAELFLGSSTSVVGFAGGDPCLVNTLNPWGNVAANPNRAQVVALCKAINTASGFPNAPYNADPTKLYGPFAFNFPFELAIASGNPNLKNEKAKTKTIGLVLTSPFEGILDRASLTVDWYKIDIKDAIAQGDSLAVYADCFNADGKSNPTYAYIDSCKLIARDQDGYRATVITPYLNLGGIATSGIDVQFNWPFNALGGKWTFNTVVNFLDYFRDQQTSKSPVIDRTGTLSGLGGGAGGNYDYRVFTTLTYMRNDWSVGLRNTFLPSIKSAAYATNPATTVQGAGAYSNLSAFGSYRLSKNVSVRGGIDNLLDRDPAVVGRNPGVTNALGSTSPGFYDPIGRRYYLAAEVNF